MKIKSPKDFWAGLLFVAFGLFSLLVARTYRMGSATSMGPAYFPTLLGGLMAGLGAVVFFRSFVIAGSKVPPISLKQLFLITLALVAFGYLLKPLGLVLSLALLIGISAFAGHESRLPEVLLLAAGLIVMALLVFVTGLGLPFPLWPSLRF